MTPAGISDVITSRTFGGAGDGGQLRSKSSVWGVIFLSTMATGVKVGSFGQKDARVLKKVALRLLPFLFVLYIINYLDRINIGFAALSMNKDIGLTATSFGLANAIFYAGYVVCEIPSNLMMARFGARSWLSRIMITWGIASAATMFVGGAVSLYGVRFLVGVLEAGFVPGVLLYLTYWFPDTYRARANGLMMMAQPTAMALGAGVSGYIMDGTNGWLGLQGWRWLFLLEGVPATILGIAAYFYLTDRPKNASWLSAEERKELTNLLEDGRPTDRVRSSIWSQVFDTRVILLALAYFCLVNSLNANSTWTPTIVSKFLKTYSLSHVGLISAIPAVCALIAMPLWAMNSDRTGERRWHIVAAMALTAVGWLLVIFAEADWMQLLGLMFTTSGAFSAMSTFWTLPQSILPEEVRPAGMGLISAIGLLGSAFSPAIIGYLRDLTGKFGAGLAYAAVLLVVGMVLILLVWRIDAQRAVRM